jgi:hypothetical protein
MSPEHELNNIASWKAILGRVDRFSENANWTPWKTFARKFVCEGIELGLDRYFRAGMSMNHLLFSTLDHNGLQREPRVTVEFRRENKLRVAYGTTNLFVSSAELEYTLPLKMHFLRSADFSISCGPKQCRMPFLTNCADSPPRSWPQTLNRRIARRMHKSLSLWPALSIPTPAWRFADRPRPLSSAVDRATNTPGDR